MVTAYLKRLYATSRVVPSEVFGLGVTVIGFAALLWVVDLGGDPLRAQWGLVKARVLEGEVWRLATGHLVNLSHVHTLMNMLGVAFVTATVWSVLTARDFLRAVLISGATVSIGWMILQPPEAMYVGFSSILHGIFAYGALMMLTRGAPGLGALVLAGLSVKIGQELINGAVPGAVETIGGEVSLISHALGTMGGALAARGGEWRVRLIIVVLMGADAVYLAEPGLALRLGG
jgi:rhomboid family GlyGly-CTERM serine protease